VTSPSPPTAAQLLGQVLDGKYRLDAVLGKGGMGAVFRGTQVPIERRVAIKIIHPELAGDPAVARRFAREARGTFRVESEHAIRVLDFAASADPQPGLLYMVMELLDGRTVAQELDVDGALAPRRALHVARQTALALAAAHRVGLVHRDIKPDNIMLIRHGDDPDFAKVLDFGLAKLIEDAPGDAALSAVALTKHGMVFGTPDYMSPEQATGKPLDARSDVYALGATLFEMLTARPPFLGANAMAVLVQHVKAAPPRLGDVVPALGRYPGLDALIERCLAKPAGARPGSAQELVAMIDAVAAALPAAAAGGAAAETLQLPPGFSRDAATHSVWLARLSADGDPSPEAPSEALVTPGGGWGMPGAQSDAGASASALSGIAGRLEPESGASVPVQIRRWPILAAGVAALVGVVAVALAMRGGRGETAARASAAGPLANVVERGDAAASPLPVPVAAPAADASPLREPPDASVATARVPDRTPPPDGGGERRRRELADHLAAAEAAFRGKNQLKQMAEAEAVLELDRRHARANFLFGEALVRAGDAASGCAYLKKSRTAAARAVMAEARCK
jgi:serine/threonine protein kinase